MNYENVIDAVNKRFPNAKFCISCFNTVDEIENKVLVEDVDNIIFSDYYYDFINNKNVDFRDYFIIHKKNGENKIYYKDVFDTLIDNNFVRDDCNHKYLELITEYNTDRRNKNSLKMFYSVWGS